MFKPKHVAILYIREKNITKIVVIDCPCFSIVVYVPQRDARRKDMINRLKVHYYVISVTVLQVAPFV
jgi:hypothetical protein